jgi:3-dehydrosphinganine reductase
MQVNYWGCYHVAHVLLPGMLARNSGHLCFVSSMVYVAPMAGYTGYSPTKAAVRHLADCLRSEVLGTGVSISVGYPPDTQTPGFDKENETKPGETIAVMEAVQDQVYTADAVAKCMFRGLQRGVYHLPNPDFGHSMGLSLVAGLSPRPKWAILEVLLAPILVIVAMVLRYSQDRAVLKYREKVANGVTAQT